MRMECSGESFLRQLSVGSSPSSYYHHNPSSAKGSRRWGAKKRSSSTNMEEDYSISAGMSVKKRVMVVIDHSTRAKHAMMWALTHIANKGDLLTLLHVVSPPQHHQHKKREQDHAPNLANSLGSLCKACKPEVINPLLFFLHFKITVVV